MTKKKLCAPFALACGLYGPPNEHTHGFLGTANLWWIDFWVCASVSFVQKCVLAIPWLLGELRCVESAIDVGYITFFRQPSRHCSARTCTASVDDCRACVIPIGVVIDRAATSSQPTDGQQTVAVAAAAADGNRSALPPPPITATLPLLECMILADFGDGGSSCDYDCVVFVLACVCVYVVRFPSVAPENPTRS